MGLGRNWTKEEEQFLSDNWGQMSDEEIALQNGTHETFSRDWSLEGVHDG